MPEMEDVKTIVQVLDLILAGLDEKDRKQILGWVEGEIERRAIVEYCQDEGSPPFTVAAQKEDGSPDPYESGGPLVWRLGQPNPLDEDATIFAMFYDWESRMVTAFSYKETSIDGRAAHSFFRSVVCKPVHVHGPVHHFALVNEIGEFMAEDEPGAGDPTAQPQAGARANGNASA